MLQFLRLEHIEDMNRLVGIVKNNEQAKDAIEGAAWRRVVHRLPWLLLGLGGSVVATWVMKIGLFLPWLIGRFGKDPAYGSGPVATILQDLLSLLTYFLMVSILL